MVKKKGKEDEENPKYRVHWKPLEASIVSVPADTTVELAGTSKLVLETGDKIQGLASAASDVEVFVSYLEIT